MHTAACAIAGGALVAIAGCASDRRAALWTSDVGSSDGTRADDGEALHLRRATLRFDVDGLAAVPLVRATVGRTTTWMQVDSGAAAHMLPTFLARRAGLGPVVDASSITLAGWGRLDAGRVDVLDQSEGLPGVRAGLAGLVSPQRLSSLGTVVVDLARAELRTVDAREAARELDTNRVEVTADAERCQGMFVVTSGVEGHRVRLLVDTGAAITALYMPSPAAIALAPRSVATRARAFSVEGTMATRVVERASLAAGDLRVVIDLTLVSLARSRIDDESASRPSNSAAGRDARDGAEPSVCGEDGVLGVDVLRRCILVFDARLRIRCG